MIKITIEDTETKEVKEFEGVGIILAMPQIDMRGIGCQVCALGGFTNPVLKAAKKEINKVVKMALKGEGRVE